jgi:hypothetical protein
MAAAGLVVLGFLILPAIMATRQKPNQVDEKARAALTPAGNPDGIESAELENARRDELSPSPTLANVDRTRAIAAWKLSEGDNPQAAAIKIQQLVRDEPDERVRCEIIGAASTLDATPALHELFRDSAVSTQPSRVRQVALDLWLTVFPDEAPTIARRFLTDEDEEVRSVAEEFFMAKKEEEADARIR